MEPHTDTDPLRLEPEEESYRALIQDLRSLPRAQAPSDFARLLQQRIAAAPATPWWRRLPGMDPLFPSRVPAFAYGAVALVAVVAFSLYVYKASNIEQQLQPAPRTEEEVLQEQTKEAPAAPATRDASAKPENTRQAPAEGTPAEDLAAPAPAPTESGKSAPAAVQPAQLQTRQSADTRRDADAKQEAAPDADRRKENVPFQMMPVDPAYAPTMRGVVTGENADSALKDSTAVRDSLRRLDALKKAGENLQKLKDKRGE